MEYWTNLLNKQEKVSSHTTKGGLKLPAYDCLLTRLYCIFIEHVWRNRRYCQKVIYVQTYYWIFNDLLLFWHKVVCPMNDRCGGYNIALSRIFPLSRHNSLFHHINKYQIELAKIGGGMKNTYLIRYLHAYYDSNFYLIDSWTYVLIWPLM